jgi:hypothetical protein
MNLTTAAITCLHLVTSFVSIYVTCTALQTTWSTTVGVEPRQGPSRQQLLLALTMLILMETLGGDDRVGAAGCPG